MIFKCCVGFTLALLHLIMEEFAHADVYYAASLFTGDKQNPITEVTAPSMSLCSVQCLLQNCKAFSYSKGSCRIKKALPLTWDGNIIVKQFRLFTIIRITLSVIISSTPSSSSYPAEAAVDGASCVNGFQSSAIQSFLLVDLGATYWIDNVTFYSGPLINQTTFQATFSDSMQDPSLLATGSQIVITGSGGGSGGTCLGKATGAYNQISGAPSPRKPGRYILIKQQGNLDVGEIAAYGFI